MTDTVPKEKTDPPAGEAYSLHEEMPEPGVVVAERLPAPVAPSHDCTRQRDPILPSREGFDARFHDVGC